jgi:hypothetical protein
MSSACLQMHICRVRVLADPSGLLHARLALESQILGVGIRLVRPFEACALGHGELKVDRPRRVPPDPETLSKSIRLRRPIIDQWWQNLIYPQRMPCAQIIWTTDLTDRSVCERLKARRRVPII